MNTYSIYVLFGLIREAEKNKDKLEGVWECLAVVEEALRLCQAAP